MQRLEVSGAVRPIVRRQTVNYRWVLVPYDIKIPQRPTESGSYKMDTLYLLRQNFCK